MRKNIIMGNWKMHFTIEETEEFLNSLLPKVKNAKTEVVVCPPFTSLALSSNILKGSNVKLGAQNVHFEEKGAFTGEISPNMLKNLGVSYIIIGHSERRMYFGETDETVNKKIHMCLKHKFNPVLCVGESLEEKESNNMEKVLTRQIEKAFFNISEEDAKKVVIAYEPIWAIGTGKTATSFDADNIISFIRKVISGIYNKEVSENIVMLYGGSVKPNTIKEQMSMENIDGALVGGASIVVEDFERIVNF
ncbi:Triosephosphate isomerase [Candidatus Arthromitus sp. SFB-mouse-SU]|uniref:triose-phosphate isomerase n=1 Tax=Candidatus Arthromitus sp. SFB-mouse TaxID=49118 RepID=UPI0002250F19|nr:triose-phosphate isomerase [Candidatus Arthromitus sp. SFB-mouse]EIA22821.1 Triosephosphate isomerase [Candidatus Arthromitus sp. SFB-1]EIA25535.1 Triosephosphate isomerase [Candidatus Arthromitus sp. SFB-4]EIA28252.1 Triosephosphate isomerase [Candidatus Arthromitus sp. SFB-co]EIA31163.1 Triosephosphate isomerase [Candidatus Arthromitus sp. SFB-mouse-SU]EGX27999.1 triose-phosphate isomerase [Candidatus Arthromitus sp. SFB-mouse-NYU]